MSPLNQPIRLTCQLSTPTGSITPQTRKSLSPCSNACVRHFKATLWHQLSLARNITPVRRSRAMPRSWSSLRTTWWHYGILLALVKWAVPMMRWPLLTQRPVFTAFRVFVWSMPARSHFYLLVILSPQFVSLLFRTLSLNWILITWTDMLAEKISAAIINGLQWLGVEANDTLQSPTTPH
jgi:hypothetical protein